MTSSPRRGPGARCPICRAAATQRFAPFCSARCADRDLARWIDGVYAIPGPPLAVVAGLDDVADEDWNED